MKISLTSDNIQCGRTGSPALKVRLHESLVMSAVL